MISLLQIPACVQVQRLRWKSKWIASCLPKAEHALRRSPRIIEAIDKVEVIDNYRSVLDAAAACFLPELRRPIMTFYANKNAPRLLDWPAEAVARFDDRLVSFFDALASVQDSSAIEAAIVAARTTP